jgi:hypothetical protein
MSGPEGQGGLESAWVDMGRYPNLDPDEALPGPVLETLREILDTAHVAPLPADVWAAAVQHAVEAASQTDAGGPVTHSGHEALRDQNTGQDAHAQSEPGHAGHVSQPHEADVHLDGDPVPWQSRFPSGIEPAEHHPETGAADAGGADFHDGGGHW